SVAPNSPRYENAKAVSRPGPPHHAACTSGSRLLQGIADDGKRTGSISRVGELPAANDDGSESCPAVARGHDGQRGRITSEFGPGGRCAQRDRRSHLHLELRLVDERTVVTA